MKDIETAAVAVVEQSGLAVQISDRALEQYQQQIERIKSFVQNNLRKDVDFGTIPNTPKPCLYKPGAEKLAKYFMLGSRIVNREREIDRQNGFAMFSYTIEVYSLQTGAVIAQCEGSANTEEKRNRNREAADLLNTLGKMAQKRAYVGAVIMAVGASDFFAPDLDDTHMGTKGDDKAAAVQADLDREVPPAVQSGTPKCELCSAVMRRTKRDDAWGCPNWNDGRKNHGYIKD